MHSKTSTGKLCVVTILLETSKHRIRIKYVTNCLNIDKARLMYFRNSVSDKSFTTRDHCTAV